jgi:hypothetical protein
MSLDSPEEIRPFEDDKGQLELVNIKEGGVGRATTPGSSATSPAWSSTGRASPTTPRDEGYSKITMAHQAAGRGTESAGGPSKRHEHHREVRI